MSRIVASSFVALVLTSSAVATAQSGAGAAPSGGYSADELSRQGFVAVESGLGESIAGGPLMLAAYAVFLLMIGGYLLAVSRRQAVIVADMDALRRRVADIDADLDAIEKSSKK